MLDSIFSTVITNGITPASFAACTAVSLISGLLISLCHGIRGGSSKGFAVTTALLPFAVQTVIMLVNGNLGTGVAVAGAFSLVRFRSSPGTAKEILNIHRTGGGACGGRRIYRRGSYFRAYSMRRRSALYVDRLRRKAKNRARA